MGRDAELVFDPAEALVEIRDAKSQRRNYRGSECGAAAERAKRLAEIRKGARGDKYKCLDLIRRVLMSSEVVVVRWHQTFGLTIQGPPDPRDGDDMASWSLSGWPE